MPVSGTDTVTYTAPCPCGQHDTTWTATRDGAATTAAARCRR